MNTAGDPMEYLQELRETPRRMATTPIETIPLDLPELFQDVKEVPLLEIEPTPEQARATSCDILNALLERHSPPEWASFAEMRCAGWRDDTRIDLFTVNTWASQRLRCVSYEIKVSRSDFQRELKKPLKRRLAERVSYECYFAAPARLIKPSELPEGWGLVELFHWGLRVKTRAPRRQPEPWPNDFIAMLARRSPQERPIAT